MRVGGAAARGGAAAASAEPVVAPSMRLEPVVPARDRQGHLAQRCARAEARLRAPSEAGCAHRRLEHGGCRCRRGSGQAERGGRRLRGSGRGA